jgi:hypothetical protein
MNRRFIAPFLAVDVTGSRAGDGYSAGSRAPSANDADAGFPTGMDRRPMRPRPAVAAPSPANPSILAAHRTDPRSG